MMAESNTPSQGRSERVATQVLWKGHASADRIQGVDLDNCSVKKAEEQSQRVSIGHRPAMLGVPQSPRTPMLGVNRSLSATHGPLVQLQETLHLSYEAA